MLADDNMQLHPKKILLPVDFSPSSGAALKTATEFEQHFQSQLVLLNTYGWRRGEMLGLQVRQVDLQARTIRLDPGTTKNGEGREVVMTPEVEELMRTAAAKKKPTDSVFTREDGKPIKDFRGAWRNLCVRAGTGRWECEKCGVTLAGVKCECGGVRASMSG
jgi:integrase